MQRFYGFLITIVFLYIVISFCQHRKVFLLHYQRVNLHILTLLNLKRFHHSKQFKREERPPSPVVVNGEEDYELEMILRHKGKGA